MVPIIDLVGVKAPCRQPTYPPLVYAIFRGSVRIIDHAKRAALSKVLLAQVTSTGPGENLDEKLAALTVIPEQTSRQYPQSTLAEIPINTPLPSAAAQL